MFTGRGPITGFIIAALNIIRKNSSRDHYCKYSEITLSHSYFLILLVKQKGNEGLSLFGFVVG